MSENKEPNRSTSEKTDGKWNTRKVIDISNSWIYHEVTISSRKEYNCDGLQ